MLPGSKATFPRFAVWGIAPAICLSVYWLGLWCWFRADDFSLLFLVRLPAEEFWPGLLEPRAQGTFRPLSEKLFFYLFHGWFGFDAFPFRAAAFAVHFANLTLLTLLTRRLSGKLYPGIFAASLWTVHHGLAYPLTWSSAFNQILCSFFLLAGLLLFARFASGGGRIWYGAQLAAFLAGLASLETAVVYPALCLALGFAQRWKRALWALALLPVSAGFAWLQSARSTGLRGPLYALSFQPETVLANLAWYAREAAAPLEGRPYLLPCALILAALAALYLRDRNRAGLFGLGWFFITLAPYLVFEGRQMHYYLAIPAAGMAVFLAGALNWKRSFRLPVAAAAFLAGAVIAWQSIAFGRTAAANNYRSGASARALLTGDAHVRGRHPHKTILLTDVAQPVFYGSIYHDVFRLAGIYDVYLTPDGNAIAQLPGYKPIAAHFASARDTRLLLERGAAVVYSAAQPRLREITSRYRALLDVRLGP